MDFNIKKMLGDIRTHLAGLTVSQKMLIGTLVIGITVGLIWLVSWAGEPERVPLLDQPMSAEEVARTSGSLSGMGVDYKVEGDRILVPKARQSELLGRLSGESALPSNIEHGFKKYLESSGSIWDTTSQQSRKFRIVKQFELARWLRYWPGVSEAAVFIDKDSAPGIGRPAGDVTASVSLRFKPGHKLTSRRARMVADFLSSAVSDLKRDRVSVFDATNILTFKPESTTDGYSTVLHELREAVEKYYKNKLLESLGFIHPHIRSTVNVKLKQTTIEKVERNFEKAKSIVETLRYEETRSKTTKGMAGSDPGIRPMSGMSIKATDAGSSSENSSEKTDYLPALAVEYLKELVGKGGIEQIDASVMLPSTHIERIAKAKKPDAEVGFRDQAYNDALAEESKRVRGHASGALGVDQDSAMKLIRVSDYLFSPEEQAAAGVAMASAGGGALEGVGTILNQYGKPVLLGVVALVSLFLVASMVKRAAPAPLVIRETVSEAGEAEDVAGEAEQLEGVLQGIEVDEDTLRVNSMVEQVNEMVNDNLDSATGLVRRWIQEDT